MMVKINLLPWRDEYREEKRIEFFKVAGFVVAVVALIIFAWDRVVAAQISNQQLRNDRLNQKISELDSKVQEIATLKERRQQLLDRMEVIQSLQGNRPEIVRIFDEMVAAVPEGIYLSKLERNGKGITFTGFAESNNRVSAYMRNLDQSYKFSSPVLTKVLADDRLGVQGSTFDMQIQVNDPEVVESTAGEGK